MPQPVDSVTVIDSPPRIEDQEIQQFLDGLVDQLNELISTFGFAINELQSGVTVTAQFQVQFEAPKGVKTGWVAYADGTSWNPGAGEGLYVYKSDNAWHIIA